MKHLKSYENIEYEVGYYVIMNTNSSHKVLIEFLSENVGKIIFVDRRYVMVEYENVPYGLKYEFDINGNENERQFYKELIKHISKDKEELEAMIVAEKKYNL